MINASLTPLFLAVVCFVVLHFVATWVVGSRKRWAAAQTGEQPVSSTFLKDIFNKNIFWKNESCTPLILPIVDIFLLNSSFKTLTSLLKLWQPLRIRFDISRDENVKLYFDFFLQRQDWKACASRWCGWTWYWKIVNLVTHCVHQQTLLRQREHFEDKI